MCKRFSHAVALVLVLCLAGGAWADLVGHWRLDEGSGTTTKDASGNGNNGTFQAAPVWVAGMLGKALQFDGDDSVNCGDASNLSFTQAVSIALWVNPANLTGDRAFAGRSAASSGYAFKSNSTHLRFTTPTIRDHDGNNSILQMNTWQHVAVTFAANQTTGCVFYINGVATDTLAASNLVGGPGPFEIGHNHWAQWCVGMIDDVRVYDHVLTAQEVMDAMRGEGPGAAREPSPEDGATDVPADSVLTWTPGEFAVTHDVYIGTAFADVNDASRANPGAALASQGQADAQYDPDGLMEYGQTYYWRVDEVNGAPDNTIFKGSTWSFTVEPFAYPITGITATASSAQTGMGPQNTVNGSGLNADDQHGTEPTTMWMTNGAQPAWIQFEFAGVEKLHEMWVWNTNQMVEAFLGFGAKKVTIEYSTDGAAWTALEGVPEFSRAPGAPAYAANTTVSFGGAMAKYVKLTIENNWGGVAPQTGLAEVRFFSIPVQAFNPVPADDAADVSVEIELNWRPGREATSHKVFIGTDSNAVADGTAAAETVTDHSYSPADLLLATEYFWKVDEVGDAGTYAGNVWSFTTEPYAVVEDFESYTDDEGNRIYEIWIDGLTDGDNGSQVGYNEAPFAEKTIIHGGAQSMPVAYDNASFAFSEARLTLDPPQDWTGRNIKTLSVHFAGTTGNTGTLYLKINNTKLVYDGDATDVARTGWQAWNIDLAKAGNVSSVKTLTVGIEGAGAKGMLYIDDIRLSPETPEFTTPVEPPAANLIARYTLDGNVQDSSGKGRNGTANGEPSYLAGVDGQALHLDGIDDYVAVGSVGISGTAPRTICGWVKADTTTITDWTNLFGFTSSPTGVAAQSFDMNKRGGANQYCIHVYGWERNIMAIDLEWHHLAATYDGTTVAWYGDGQFVGSEAWVLNTQDLVQMGKRAHAGGGNFPGSLDEIRIYDTALSAEEIAWLAGRRLPIHKPQ